MNYRTLTSADAPTLWPECSQCHAAFVFGRVLTLTGTAWLWTRNCNHKKALPVMMTADGEYLPPSLGEQADDA